MITKGLEFIAGVSKWSPKAPGNCKRRAPRCFIKICFWVELTVKQEKVCEDVMCGNSSEHINTWAARWQWVGGSEALSPLPLSNCRIHCHLYKRRRENSLSCDTRLAGVILKSKLDIIHKWQFCCSWKRKQMNFNSLCQYPLKGEGIIFLSYSCGNVNRAPLPCFISQPEHTWQQMKGRRKTFYIHLSLKHIPIRAAWVYRPLKCCHSCSHWSCPVLFTEHG